MQIWDLFARPTFLGILAGSLSILLLSACSSSGGKAPAANSVASQLPTITAQPTDVTVVAGAAATFAVLADGDPAPTFQWERGGPGGWSAIPGGSSKTYSFRAQAADHGATFRGLATNSQGTATSTVATLSVNAPPTLKGAPETRTVSAGDSLSFTVAATANGNLSYQWRKGGMALPSATDATLNLSNLKPADSGIYDVEVTSTLNQTKVSATGNSVTVSVVGQPTLSLNTSTPNPLAGETVSLTPSFKDAVRATVGTSLGGTDLAASASDGVSIPTRATMGSQIYYLRAFNVLGGFADATATVTHQTVRVSVARPANLNISVGQSLTFVPVVSGGLSNTVAWSGAGTWNGAAWTASASAGKATIRATSVDDPNISDSFDMNVVALPTPSLAANPVQLRSGETTNLLPTLKDSVRATLGTSQGGSEIAATVSDGVSVPTRATTGNQTYYLRAFNAAGSYVDATVSVTHQTVRVSVARPANLNVSVGQSLTFVPVVSGGLSNTVAWSGAGTWNGAAWTAPAAIGKATIRATSVDDPNVSDSFDMNVVALPTPALVASPVQPRFGETTSLLPTLKDTVRAALGTSLGGSEIAASVSDGVAIPTSATTGNQTYYLRAFNAAGSYADATLNVTHQTVQIGSISPALSTLAVGGQATFSASVTGGLKGTVQWSASSGAFDTATGQWTAATVPGNCVITATSDDDATQTKTLTVKVVPGPATKLGISFPATVVLGESGTCTITALDTYGNTATAFAGTISFSSSDAYALLPVAQSLTQGAGFFPVTLKSSGSKSLTATSGAMSVSQGVTVQYTAPAFSQQPADLTVDPNLSSAFTVTATGLPAPEISWESSPDGTNWSSAIGSATSSLVTGGASSTLTFTPQLTDSGRRYRATAQSLDGGTFRTATSSVAQLTVAFGKVYIGGSSKTADGVIHAGYWRDTTWVSLPELSPAHNSKVNVMVLTATDVYAGGFCMDANGLMIPGYWKNGVWTGLAPDGSSYGQNTQVKYMDVKPNGWDAKAGCYTTVVGAVGIPGTAGPSGEGNVYWINGNRNTFLNFAGKSFSPKGITAFVSNTWYCIPVAFVGQDNQADTSIYFYDPQAGTATWRDTLMPANYVINGWSPGVAGSYEDLFAGGKTDSGGKMKAGYVTSSGSSDWHDLTLPNNDTGVIQSLITYGNAMYACVYGTAIGHYLWDKGNWVKPPAGVKWICGSIFANQDGYYQAGASGGNTAGEGTAGYIKSGVWNPVGSSGGTPTCIVAR